MIPFTSGMPGEPLPYLLHTDWMITIILFLCILGTTFAFSKEEKYLLQQLSIINPKVVLALGDSATKAILDIKYNKFSEIVGKQYCINDIVIIPIYHPSPISPKSYNGNVEIFENVKKVYRRNLSGNNRI